MVEGGEKVGMEMLDRIMKAPVAIHLSHPHLCLVSCVLVVSGRIGLTPLSQYTSLSHTCDLCLVSWLRAGESG